MNKRFLVLAALVSAFCTLVTIVSFDMAPKKRSPAQLAAAGRGTSTKKNKAAKKQRMDADAVAEAERVLSRAFPRAA